MSIICQFHPAYLQLLFNSGKRLSFGSSSSLALQSSGIELHPHAASPKSDKSDHKSPPIPSHLKWQCQCPCLKSLVIRWVFGLSSGFSFQVWFHPRIPSLYLIRLDSALFIPFRSQCQIIHETLQLLLSRFNSQSCSCAERWGRMTPTQPPITIARSITGVSVISKRRWPLAPHRADSGPAFHHLIWIHRG